MLDKENEERTSVISSLEDGVTIEGESQNDKVRKLETIMYKEVHHTTL